MGTAEKNEMRRLVKMFEDIDTDDSDCSEWEEFVNFFRRGGYLSQCVADVKDPRQRLAKLFAIHERRCKQEFETLARAHRSLLERDLLKQVPLQLQRIVGATSPLRRGGKYQSCG